MELQKVEQAAQHELQQADKALAVANNIVITNDDEYVSASEYIKQLREAFRKVDDEEKSGTKPLNETLKKIRGWFKPTKDKLEQAADIVKRKRIDYERAVEAKRQEEQRKAEEAARKERERLEKRRLDEERKAREREEALRKAAEEADAAERQKIEARIAAARERSEAKQEEFAQQAASVTAPIIHRAPPKVAGVATRGVWKAEIEDLDAVIKAAAAGDTMARACLCADAKVLTANAKAMKENFKVPGVRVWEDKTVAA